MDVGGRGTGVGGWVSGVGGPKTGGGERKSGDIATSMTPWLPGAPRRPVGLPSEGEELRFIPLQLGVGSVRRAGARRLRNEARCRRPCSSSLATFGPSVWRPPLPYCPDSQAADLCKNVRWRHRSRWFTSQHDRRIRNRAHERGREASGHRAIEGLGFG